MTHKESSVMSSLRQLQLDQEQQCREQARLALLRESERARELLRAEAVSAETARLKHEKANGDALRATEEKRLEYQRQQRDRQLELERVRAELELSAKVRLMELEQQQSLQRLALQRDAQVKRFEGQRAMLLSLLATLLVGTISLWGLLVHPQLRHSEALAKQATLALAAARSELKHQRTRFEAQISDLESRNRDLSSQVGLQLARSRSLVELVQGAKPQRSVGLTKPVNKQATCSAQDPLCGDLS